VRATADALLYEGYDTIGQCHEAADWYAYNANSLVKFNDLLTSSDCAYSDIPKAGSNGLGLTADIVEKTKENGAETKKFAWLYAESYIEGNLDVDVTLGKVDKILDKVFVAKKITESTENSNSCSTSTNSNSGIIFSYLPSLFSYTNSITRSDNQVFPAKPRLLPTFGAKLPLKDSVKRVKAISETEGNGQVRLTILTSERPYVVKKNTMPMSAIFVNAANSAFFDQLQQAAE